MADKTIFVDEYGNVSEDPARVVPKQKVIWQSRNEQEFTVEFTSKVPFRALKWLNRKETGKNVDGKVKSHGAGTHHYEYRVTTHENIAPDSNPELIVDGGRGFKKSKKSATRRGAVKAKAAKRSGTRKSVRSASPRRKKSPRKAVKAAARTKR